MSRLFILASDLWPLFGVYGLYLSAAAFVLVGAKQTFRIGAAEGSGTVVAVAAVFGIAGIATGYLTGLSRNPAVDSVVPAVLTLFGGFAVYLMTSERNTRFVSTAAATVSLFFFFMLASLTGAQVRETAITAQKAARAQFLLDYDTQGALALQESRVLELRREYGLTGAAFDLDQKATSEKAPE